MMFKALTDLTFLLLLLIKVDVCVVPFLLTFFFIRSVKKSEDDVPVPPLVKSALLWGMPSLTSFLFVTAFDNKVRKANDFQNPYPPAILCMLPALYYLTPVYLFSIVPVYYH